MGENCKVYYRMLSEESRAESESLLEYERGVALKLLKRGFLELFHIELQKEQIQREAEGKPYYTGGEGYYFNISHCKDAVVVAVSECPVGVDVEGERNVKYRTAEKCCSLEEMAYVFGEEEVDRSRSENLSEEETARFLNLWTLKESYVKMTGRGLRIAPKKVNFEVNGFDSVDENTFHHKRSEEIECYLHREADIVLALTLQKKNPETAVQVSWISCTASLEQI